MLVSDFNYELPDELIAQEALADRAGSRLLHVESGAAGRFQAGELHDRQFREFPELLRQGAYLSPSVEAALRPASAAE